MAHWRTHLKRAQAAASLAVTYAEDGALHTASDRFHEAADELKKAAVARDRLLEKLSEKVS